MRVAITGATGFIGGHITSQAIRSGHDVVALIRSPAKLAASMASLDVEMPDYVVGDMTDKASVASLVGGVDAVVHAAAIVSLAPRDAQRVVDQNTLGTQLVLSAAANAGLDPIVHLSSTSALFEPGGEPIRTDTPPTTATFPYARAKAQAEAIARELQADGRNVAIVYPGGVIGPPAGDAFGEAGTGITGFIAPALMPTRHATMSFIDVRDLAALVVALLEPNRGARRFVATGTHCDMTDLAAVCSTLTGRTFRVPPVPAAMLRGSGIVMDRIRRVIPFSSPLTEEGMTTITRWNGAHDTDLTPLGITLRPLEVTMADTMRALRDRGHLKDRHIGQLA
jgi:nucleoside-diphosphate-sugar epimerase